MTPAEFKAIRKAAGLTQAEMAEVLDVSRKTLVNWEKGYFQIPSDIATQIAAKGLSKTKPATAKPLKYGAEPYYMRDPLAPKGLKGVRRSLDHPLWYQSSRCPAYAIIKRKAAAMAAAHPTAPPFDVDREATTADLDGYTTPTPDQAYRQLIAFGCTPKAAYDYLVNASYGAQLTVADPEPLDPRIRHENEWLIKHGSLAGFFEAYPQYAPPPAGEPDPALVAAFANAFKL